MGTYHVPVMLKEVISYLNVQPGKWYVDCNLGGGGHTEGILQAGGKVLGIDLDPDAIREVAQNHGLKIETVDKHLVAKSNNLILYQTNFANLKAAVKQLQNVGPIMGVLFDLGVSTHQLETPKRGFSFNLEGPLDMRMNPQSPIPTASDLINALHEKELAEMFWRLGEERFAKPIARRIIEVRNNHRIDTVNELAEIVTSVRHRTSADRTHPATRIFQALRIVVNDELNSLKTALPQALDILEPDGRIAVISFHSLEDRIAKNFFKNKQEAGTIEITTKKPVVTSKQEIIINPRSRSAKLRVAQKL